MPYGRYLHRVIGAMHVISTLIHWQIGTLVHWHIEFTSAIPESSAETRIRISIEQLRIARGLSCF